MFEWSILPRQSNDSECFNPRCWNIYSYKTIELKANIAYQIDLGFHLSDCEKNILLEVQQHLCDKPWRIVDKYLCLNSWTKTITITIIANKPCTIQRGHILGHIQPVFIHDVYNNIKGKFLFSNTYIVIIIIIIIYFFYLFLEWDEVYFSDDDDDDDLKHDPEITDFHDDDDDDDENNENNDNADNNQNKENRYKDDDKKEEEEEEEEENKQEKDEEEDKETENKTNVNNSKLNSVKISNTTEKLVQSLDDETNIIVEKMHNVHLQ